MCITTCVHSSRDVFLSCASRALRRTTCNSRTHAHQLFPRCASASHFILLVAHAAAMLRITAQLSFEAPVMHGMLNYMLCAVQRQSSYDCTAHFAFATHRMDLVSVKIRAVETRRKLIALITTRLFERTPHSDSSKLAISHNKLFPSCPSDPILLVCILMHTTNRVEDIQSLLSALTLCWKEGQIHIWL